MSTLSAIISKHTQKRPWVLIAAYDVSTGESSEGLVAFNILRLLSKTYRIILLTRRNNKQKLEANAAFLEACPGVYLVGYDLPNWARWWKRGARNSKAYAYLWQMTWPHAVRSYTKLCQTLKLIHVLNFHNDSIPSLAWQLDIPVVWGPINHNELVPAWRRTFWPNNISLRHVASFGFRRLLWRIDPFLRLHIRKSKVVLSAGVWVDRRLKLTNQKNLIHRSQLGTSGSLFHLSPKSDLRESKSCKELICAGRLDWIKGVDLAIEALAFLPTEYRLRIVGEGPAEAHLRALAKQLGVEARVFFQPPVPRHALSNLYAQADQFIFTSAEVAGLVWVEALASGLPVIAFEGMTEVTYAAQTLPGITLVPSGKKRSEQVEKLAAKIREAVEVTYNPTTLRTAVMERYGWNKLTEIICEAYSVALRPYT